MQFRMPDAAVGADCTVHTSHFIAIATVMLMMCLSCTNLVIKKFIFEKAVK